MVVIGPSAGCVESVDSTAMLSCRHVWSFLRTCRSWRWHDQPPCDLTRGPLESPPCGRAQNLAIHLGRLCMIQGQRAGGRDAVAEHDEHGVGGQREENDS